MEPAQVTTLLAEMERITRRRWIAFLASVGLVLALVLLAVARDLSRTPVGPSAGASVGAKTESRPTR